MRETGRLFILKARPPSPKAHPEEDVAFSSQVEFASRLNPESQTLYCTGIGLDCQKQVELA